MSLQALFNFPKFSKAKCAKEENKDFFFPDSLLQWEERLPQLQHYCNTCIHQNDCLSYAIKNEINEGFWGGKTPTERKIIAIEQNKRGDRKNRKFKEIQQYLELGFSKPEIAIKLDIQLESLERTLERAKQRGIQ